MSFPVLRQLIHECGARRKVDVERLAFAPIGRGLKHGRAGKAAMGEKHRLMELRAAFSLNINRAGDA